VQRDPLIPRHGGYRKVKSFQVAQLVYDVTVRFCERYIAKQSRTQDQMVQAARSGMQNIAEGSQVSGTSKKLEMKLTNVARASLEELRQDYLSFLRQRGLTPWERQDARRQALVDRRCSSVEEVAVWAHDARQGKLSQGRAAATRTSTSSTPSTNPSYPEIAANGALVLIDVATAMLDRQLAAQAQHFVEEGGFTERLARTRRERRR
jgi:four helix bundle suffix protein